MQQPNPFLRVGMRLLPQASTFLRFTSWAMPDSIKRKIVMVAGFCEVERLRGVAYPRVEQLNKALEIVNTDSLLYCIRDLALPLSTEFFSCKDEPCPADMAALCHHLTEHVPSFLKYDRRSAMLNDIAKVVAFNAD